MKSQKTYPPYSDEYFMNEALKEAMLAMDKDEIPIGAVVVCGDRVIARAHNLTETLNDVTAHAEMQAFTAAANFLGGKYLDECALFVTVEPCLMCAGAAFWTQLGRLVYGSEDEKRGYHLVKEQVLHPRTTVTGGVLALECSIPVKEFFRKKRK